MNGKKKILILSLFSVLSFIQVAFAANIQYTYDSLNRLIKVDYGNGRAIQYSYDQDGNRIAQTVSATGSITVTISPQNAVNAGAEWNVDSGAWQTSGTTVSDLSVGQHTIAFSDVSGWTTPSNQSVSVSDGKTTSVTGTYATPAHLVTTLQSITTDPATGEYIATLGVTNQGVATAGNVLLTAAALNGARTLKALPVSIGNLGYNTSATVTLAFPASAGPAKGPAALTVSETYSGGSASAGFRLVLP